MSSEKLLLDYSTPETLQIKLIGDWRAGAGIPPVSEVAAQLTAHPDIKQIKVDVLALSHWDSGFVSFLLKLERDCEAKGVRLMQEGLPQGAQKLLALALKVRQMDAPRAALPEPFFEGIGGKAIKIKDGALSLLDFLGEIVFAFGRLVKGKAFFSLSDFLFISQRCGVDALPLVSLISILVGMILAFVGAIQLKLFGAQIYIADIVGIAMVRVMGAVMTGILMSGRTGASFAAELGIMQTNEEIDAFRTLGVNPVEYLVVPRVMALVLMMPLLTLYADLMGILGGLVVSSGTLGINPIEYLNHTKEAVKLNNLWVGLAHSIVFGIIIAVAGCLRGIRCDRSASGVGEATTQAVVSAITGIVIATAIITFVCQVIGV